MLAKPQAPKVACNPEMVSFAYTLTGKLRCVIFGAGVAETAERYLQAQPTVDAHRRGGHHERPETFERGRNSALLSQGSIEATITVFI